MGDRNQLRDRTLVLRILDDELRTRIQQKMTMVEEAAVSSSNNNSNRNNDHRNGTNLNNPQRRGNSPNDSTKPLNESKILDLDGVTVEPAIQRNNTKKTLLLTTNSNDHKKSKEEDDETLWNFHCDGTSYPARLQNLPCPIELHKTRNHQLYYKSVDVAQILIVYSSKKHMTELETGTIYNHSKRKDFPSYYHSGLTPPMDRVVEERLGKREHRNVPPVSEENTVDGRSSAKEVREVEKELVQLIDLIAMKDGKKPDGGGERKGKNSSSKNTTNKVMTEEVDEVVQYEPWMDNYGQGKGIEISEDDELCLMHPELWLNAEEKSQWDEKQKKKDEASSSSKKKDTEKKKKSKKKKAAVSAPIPAPAPVAAPVPAPAVDELDKYDFDMNDIDFLEGDESNDVLALDLGF